MSEFTKPEAEEYLSKKLMPKSKEVKAFPSMSFCEDQPEGKYDQLEGIVERSDFEKTLVISYRQVDSSIIPRLASGLKPEDKKDESTVSESDKKELEQFVSDDLVEIKNLEINNHVSINIRDYLPRDFIILCEPNLSNGDIPSRLCNNFILLSGNPTNLDTLLSLFHEIGHLRDYDEQVSARKGISNSLIDKTEAAQILKGERDAWAFALSKLKPFLKDYERMYAQIEAKTKLQVYSNTLRDIMLPSWVSWIMEKMKKLFGKK